MFSFAPALSLGPDVNDLSLGLVNVLEVDENEDDETREAIGDSAGTKTKWHKHTVKVLTMLQQNIRGGMPEDDENSDDEDDEGKPEKHSELHFNSMSKNCSRRTAAGVFFELLQLKTWDFI